MKFFKKLSSLALVCIQFFSLIPLNVYAKGSDYNDTTDPPSISTMSWDGTVQYDPNTKTLQIKTDAMIPSRPNTYYEYENIGYSVRYHRKDGQKYIITVGNEGIPVDGPTKGNGFKHIYNEKYVTSGGQHREKDIREITLPELVNFFQQDFPGHDFSGLLSPYENSILYFNAIFATKPAGDSTYNGYINPQRQGVGVYYTTANGSLPFNLNNYHVSSKYLRPTWYDTRNPGGVIGSKKHDTGSPWTNNAIADINNNYERDLIIYGKDKPDPYVDKKVTVTYKDSTTGGVISSGNVATYNVNNANNKTHNQSAVGIAGYTFDKSRLNYGNGEVEESRDAYRSINVSPANSKHEIIFYYTQNTVPDPTPNGNIIFNPNSNSWDNSNISIKVSITGDTTITKTGYESRSFSYTTVDGTQYSSIRQPYTQVWKPSNLTVKTTQGKNVANQNITILLDNNSTSKVINDGSSVSIITEGKEIRLNAVVNDWVSQSKTWASSSAPHNGSWTQSNVNGNTSKPTQTYSSNSGLYNLDKSKPIIENNNNDFNWKKNNIRIDLSSKENLSGLNSQKVVVSDKSHYRNPNVDYYFTGGNISSASPYFLLYNTQINLTKDGIYNIDGTIKDIANNSQSVNYGTYKLDKTLPNNTIFSDDNRVYIDDELIVNVKAKDNLSGVAKIEYAVTNKSDYSNERKTTLNNNTPENSPNAETSFNVSIKTNGTWYIHVWVTDRAGNTKYNVSNGYKYFKINPEDIIVTPENPSEGGSNNNGDGNTKNNLLRGSRFDIITMIKEFTLEDVNNSKLTYTMPNWINDDINKMINNEYAVTSGFGAKKIAKIYNNKNNKVELWSSFVPPFGTALTYNKNGQLIGNQHQANIELLYENYIYGPKKTHPVNIKFNVFPEQNINTQIIFNK